MGYTVSATVLVVVATLVFAVVLLTRPPRE
jgi:hypothetical protein